MHGGVAADERALMEALLRDGYGVPANHITRIDQGSTNANFVVRTLDTSFLLRRYARPGQSPWATQSHRREAMLYEHGVLVYAQERGIPCIAPLPDRHGETLVEADGDAYALFPYVVSQRPTLPREVIGARAARLLARYHRVMEDYPVTSQRPGWGLAGELASWFHVASLGVSRVPDLLAWLTEAPGDSDAHGYAREQAARIADLVRYVGDRHPAQAYARYPVIVNHGDYILKNIGETECGLVLYDWDCCVRELRVYDLAMLVGYTGGEEHTARNIDPRIARSVVQAYRETASMSVEELALVPYMLVAFRLRFLLNNLGRLMTTGSCRPTLRRDLEGMRWLCDHERAIVAMLTATA